MKRKITFLALLTIFSTTVLNAADVILPSGGDIQAAIDNSASGDIITLEDGGTYEQGGAIIIDEKRMVTLKAEAGAAQKPVVYTDGFRFGEQDSSGITVNGIEFDGSFSGDYFIKADQAGDGASHVKLLNSDIHSYTNGLLGVWGEPKCYVDTVLISNCYIHDLNSDGGWMCQFLSYDSRACIKYYKMENSTIDGYNELFIAYDNVDYVIRMEFDNCTFHRKVGIKDAARNTFTVNAAAGSSFSMRNCIISSIEANDETSLVFDISATVADTIENTIYNNIDASYDVSNDWNYVSNYTQMDPQYAAPNEFDLTLSASSPALTYATDGGPVGDPRWAGINIPVKNVIESKIGITTTPTMVFFSESVAKVSVHSLTGALITSMVNVNQASLVNLQSGVYVINIEDNTGASKAFKVLR